MRALLVGYGSIGRRHLANLHRLGVEDWAVVHTGQGTLPLDPPCPVRVHAELTGALARERPDVAIVANPTGGHVAAAAACARAGADLLVEKPLAASLEGLEALAEVVAERGVRVLMGFQLRFHPALHRIRGLVAEGAVGVPLHAEVVWGEHLASWHPWEDWRRSYAARADLGGGVHHTMSHPLDYLRFLFGEVASVRGAFNARPHLGLEVPESVDVGVAFEGEVDAHLHLDYWSQPPRHRLELVGSEGSISWDLLAGELGVSDGAARAWRREAVPGDGERNELFVAEARHLLEVVAGRAEPVATLEDGIEGVRLALAIERSAADGACAVPAPPP